MEKVRIDTNNNNICRALYLKGALSKLHKGKRCPLCHSGWRKVTSLRNRMMIASKLVVAKKFSREGSSPNKEMWGAGQSFLMPADIKKHLRQLWKNEKAFVEAFLPVLKTSTEEYPTDLMFIEVTVLTVDSLSLYLINLDDAFSSNITNNTTSTLGCVLQLNKKIYFLIETLTGEYASQL
jgi:hypothetical protein